MKKGLLSYRNKIFRYENNRYKKYEKQKVFHPMEIKDFQVIQFSRIGDIQNKKF